MSYSRMERLNKELERAISEEDYELALESIDDMLELESENAQLFNSKGVVLAKLKRNEDALEAFDTALRLDQGISKVWYSKGVVLMDTGNLRQALACFYKALDLEPTYEKARERFINCLDEMALRAQVKTEATIEGPYMEGPSEERTMRPPEEQYEEGLVHEQPGIEAPESEGRELERGVDEPRARKKRGTYLDDEMFGEEGGEEDWDGQGQKGIDEGTEEWSEEGDFEDWEGNGESKYVKCRCGADIKIGSDKRPFKFKCKECGRSGTLK